MDNEAEEFEFRLRSEQESALGQQGVQKTQQQPTYGENVERTGQAFDKAAGTGIKGLARTGVAAAENVGGMVSGVVGDIAGATTSAVTQDPKKGDMVRESLTYQPRTEAGKAGAQYIGALTEPVAKLFDYIPQKLDKVGHPILSQVAKAGEDVLPLKVPKALKATRAAAIPLAEKVATTGERAAKTAQAAAQDKTGLIRDVRKLGLKLTSQDVGAPLGKYGESFAGRPQYEREISQHNATKVKEAAAADVGIKEPLSKGAVNRAIEETVNSYKRPRGLGRVDLASDTKLRNTFDEIKGMQGQAAVDFPDDVFPQIEKEVSKFDRPSADADTLVDKIRSLRQRASDNFGGNADDKSLARAQKKLATALEEAIERHADTIGKGPVIEQFRADRTRLAKLYSVRDALTEGGELDLGVLERELDKGEPLTGNLRTLAKAKSVFDRSFQNPENIRGNPVGAGDVGLAALAGGAKGGIAGAVALGSRPLTRAVMASKPYQSAFIKPRKIKPSVTSRVARRIAGPKTKPKVRINSLGQYEPTGERAPATLSDLQ